MCSVCISRSAPYEKIYAVLNLYIIYIYIPEALLVELYVPSASYTSRISKILCNDQFSANIPRTVLFVIKTWKLIEILKYSCFKNLVTRHM